MGEETVPQQPETTGQFESMRVVLYEEQPSTKRLVGIHNPPNFTIHMEINIKGGRMEKGKIEIIKGNSKEG